MKWHFFQGYKKLLKREKVNLYLYFLIYLIINYIRNKTMVLVKVVDLLV